MGYIKKIIGGIFMISASIFITPFVILFIIGLTVSVIGINLFVKGYFLWEGMNERVR